MTTKFSLVLGSAPAAADSVKSIAAELRAAGDSLVVALGVLVDPGARAGAGRPLMALYCQQVRRVLRALEDLVRHAADKCLLFPSSSAGSGSGSSELAPKTGVVWAACEQLGKLPRSNKVAFRRAILQHQAAVRDTLREFGEMLLEGEESEGEGGEEEEEEDDDDTFGGGSGPLGAWEKENVARCLVALRHCGEMMKAALGAVDESAAAAAAASAGAEAEVMDGVVRVEESCEALTAAVVNAADALYPPQVCCALIVMIYSSRFEVKNTHKPTSAHRTPRSSSRSWARSRRRPRWWRRAWRNYRPRGRRSRCARPRAAACRRRWRRASSGGTRTRPSLERAGERRVAVCVVFWASPSQPFGGAVHKERFVGGQRPNRPDHLLWGLKKQFEDAR